MNGTPPGFPGNEIRPCAWTPQEIERWAHRRQPHEREPVPKTGERLLLRETDFGEAVPVVVHDIQDMTSPHDHWSRHGALEHLRGPGMPDQNVWQPELDSQGSPTGQWQMKDDPWPLVHVRAILGTDENGAEILGAPRWCREGRVRGSAGWLRPGSRAHTGRYESAER